MNLLGSLAGIGGFGVLAILRTPPSVWFGLMLRSFIYFVKRPDAAGFGGHGGASIGAAWSSLSICRRAGEGTQSTHDLVALLQDPTSSRPMACFP